MILQPPRATLTDPILPNTTLVRSADAPDQIRLTGLEVAANPTVDIRYPALLSYEARGDVQVIDSCFLWYDKDAGFTSFRSTLWFGEGPYCLAQESRSEERSVGQECGSTCRSRWSPDN